MAFSHRMLFPLILSLDIVVFGQFSKHIVNMSIGENLERESHAFFRLLAFNQHASDATSRFSERSIWNMALLTACKLFHPSSDSEANNFLL